MSQKEIYKPITNHDSDNDESNDIHQNEDKKPNHTNLRPNFLLGNRQEYQKIDSSVTDDTNDDSKKQEDNEEEKEEVEIYSNYAVNPFDLSSRFDNDDDNYNSNDIIMNQSDELDSEEDDDEYEDFGINLERYSFYSKSSTNASNPNSDNSYHDEYDNEFIPTTFRYNGICTSILSYFTFIFQLYYIIHHKRKQARKHHAERALILSGTRYGKLRLCCESWCDLWTNQGLLLAMILLSVWILLDLMHQRLSKKSYHEQPWFWIFGIILIVFRIFWWPIYWFLWGRIVEKVSLLL